ncbi:GGDEF domain-containing protein [Thalassotalea sp. G2M2-11]|uniref:GGDEF domain-containing protein n=1 Tax=Thalassotalea sp. G2M2-11 TaxID=2787627 RepID=UPI0019D20438|nr:GGDEF domain-containing protein [Thalassotalea sp. G2M2-11]
MPHKKYIHRPTVLKDLIIIVVVNVILLIAFGYFDTLEWLYQSSLDYQYLQLDELVPLGLTVSLSLLVFSYRRIVELGQMAGTLEKMALIDPLTGLPNRRSGQVRLIAWCQKAQRKGQTFVVYQLDLDEFKKVNDLYGQIVGDEVLKQVSQILNQFLPISSLLCRWLDDNFLVVVKLDTIDNPHQYAHEIQSEVTKKVMANTAPLTMSIGYKIWQKDQTVEDILHDVEDALMHAKHLGKHQIKGN